MQEKTVLTMQDGAAGSSWFVEVRHQKGLCFKRLFVLHWKQGSIAVWPAENKAGASAEEQICSKI